MHSGKLTLPPPPDAPCGHGTAAQWAVKKHQSGCVEQGWHAHPPALMATAGNWTAAIQEVLLYSNTHPCKENLLLPELLAQSFPCLVGLLTGHCRR